VGWIDRLLAFDPREVPNKLMRAKDQDHYGVKYLNKRIRIGVPNFEFEAHTFGVPCPIRKRATPVKLSALGKLETSSASYYGFSSFTVLD
jgi:hypothetical protein